MSKKETSKTRLKLLRKDILSSESDVKGQPVSFSSALLVLADYPLKDKEKWSLFRIKKQIQVEIELHTTFIKEQVEVSGGKMLPNGAIGFDGDNEKAAAFGKLIESAQDDEFEIFLDHKINIEELSNGTFEAPSGCPRPLSLSEISRLEKILVLPDED